jgi:hypothetical protein
MNEQFEKIITRRLPVALTTEEQVNFGRQLADLHNEYTTIEIGKKAATDHFKGQMERLDGRISYAVEVLRANQEYRSVECKWRYLFDTNTKELLRMDTGDIVEVAPIEAEERQLMIQMKPLVNDVDVHIKK